jgi:DNA-binding NarL/FixJ family response regulator
LLNVVIVERETLLRTGLERLLSTTPGMTVSGTADSVAAAERLPAALPADVVLAASSLPDMEGSAGVGRLLRRFAGAHIVMLGPDDDPGLVVGAFRAGADGYLTRSTPLEGLVRALRGLARGEVPLPRHLTYLLVEAVRFSAPLPAGDGAVNQLSPRERQVLTEIARGRSNAQIAARLGISETTVKTHVSNILRKTGSRSRILLQSVDSVS